MDTMKTIERNAAANTSAALRVLGYGTAEELLDGFAALTLVDVVTTRFIHAGAGVGVGVRENGGRLEIALLRRTRAGWVRTPTMETAAKDALKQALLRVVGVYFRAIESAVSANAAARAA